MTTWLCSCGTARQLAEPGPCPVCGDITMPDPLFAAGLRERLVAMAVSPDCPTCGGLTISAVAPEVIRDPSKDYWRCAACGLFATERQP